MGLTRLSKVKETKEKYDTPIIELANDSGKFKFSPKALEVLGIEVGKSYVEVASDGGTYYVTNLGTGVEGEGVKVTKTGTFQSASTAEWVQATFNQGKGLELIVGETAELEGLVWCKLSAKEVVVEEETPQEIKVVESATALSLSAPIPTEAEDEFTEEDEFPQY